MIPTDIPTALTRAESAFLEAIARDQRVLEAGALLGHSTVVLASVAQHVVSIDPHEGYPEENPRGTFSMLWRNVRRYGVASRVEVVVGDGRVELAQRKADGVFLDLTGDRDLTEACLIAAMASGAQWLAVHDYGRGNCSGVDESVDYLVRTGAWDAALVDTLVVLRRRNR